MSEFPVNGVKYGVKNIQGIVVVEAPVSIGAVIKGRCSIGYMSYTGNGRIQNTHIGRFCSIAGGFTSSPTNHPTDRFSSHLFAFGNNGPFKGSPEFEKWMRPVAYSDNMLEVNIGNDVWIGKNVIVKRGIHIGNGAVVGAGSVVTRDVAPYSIVGGVPAKLIRKRFSDEIIARLERLQWYKYRLDRESAPALDVSDIERSLETLEQLIDQKLVEELHPERFEISATDIVRL